MKKVFIIVLSILTLLPSCKKDDGNSAPQVDGCLPFPPAYGLGYNEIVGRYEYSNPTFNVTNPNEFYFVRFDYQNRTATIIKGFTDRAGLKEIVTVSGPIGTKIAAAGNYVIFTHIADFQFWRINSNGTGLIKLTNYKETAQFPSFNPAGDKLVFNYNGAFAGNQKIMVIDIEGNKLDSVSINIFHALYPTCNQNYILAGQYADSINKGICIYDMAKKQLDVLYKKEYHSYADKPVSHCWHPNGEDIYFLSDYSVNEINIHTRQKNVVKQGCNNIRYEAFALSSDGKHTLCQKVTRKYLGENQVNVDYEIYLTDGHFKNERKVSE